MTSRNRTALAAALLTTGALLLAPSTTAPGTASPPAASSAHSSEPARSTDPVAVTGAVKRSRFVTVRSLSRRFEQQELTATYTAGGISETHTFDGPLLLDVLTAAKPTFDPDVKNDHLSFAVTAIATDGYRAVVSWGELDPGFGGTPVLLATHEDGVALDRPRLVVAGDAKGGRYVSDLRRVVVRDLGKR